MREVNIFFRAEGDLIMAVLMLDLRGMVMTVPDYRQLKNQVGQMFERKGYPNIRVFTLFLVSNLESGRRLGSSDALSWVIDLSRDRLCIFEDGMVDFDTLRLGLEEILRQDADFRGITPKSAAAWIGDGLFKNKAPATLCLILLNLLCFAAVSLSGSTEDVSYMISRGAMLPSLILENQEFYRFLTCMFLHFGLEHLAANMLALWLFGERVENVLGQGRFLLLYFLSGLAGSAASFASILFSRSPAASAGASGAIFGVIGALLFLEGSDRKRVGRISPVRFAMILSYVVFSSLSGGVDAAAHMGGLLMGILLCFFMKRGRKPSSPGAV